jgi:hypothetical protein
VDLERTGRKKGTFCENQGENILPWSEHSIKMESDGTGRMKKITSL